MREKEYQRLSLEERQVVDRARNERRLARQYRYKTQQMGWETRLQRVHRVRVTAINIPDWAKPYALAGMDDGPSVIWVKRRAVAKRIAEIDREAGGKPERIEHDGYRCPTCRGWYLGLNAQDVAHRVELAKRAGMVESFVCGIHCTAPPKGAPKCR